MKFLWNKSLSILLTTLLLILTVISPLPALASQQAFKSIKITDTKISQIVNKAYTGKRQTQKPVIMDGSYKLKPNTDYTLSYKNNVKIGLASVIIMGKGKYSGTVRRTFQINPAKTILIDIVPNESSVTLTWKKNTGSDGYQIYYATEKKGKFVQLSDTDITKTTYTVKNVKEGIWYYKIRAYKTVKEKTYYGKFSDVRSVEYRTDDSSLPSPTISSQPERDERLTMNITVGNKTFAATLENNDTAKAMADQLPLTVNMSGLNGNEKYNYLSGNLRADTSSCPGTINEGDIMLYGDNCLVLFYKTFQTSYSYVRLGHIDNTTGLAETVGSGSIQVTFTISD